MTLRHVLTPRALAAWAGTDRLSALPLHLPRTAPMTPAARLFALLVAGDTVPWDPALAEIVGGEVALDIVGGKARAPVSILPLGPSLLVCDRLDADDSTGVVCWPDDSSYHLAHAIPPGRRNRWLDVACGSAFAPLLRPDLAASIVGTDLNPRAVRYAQHGVELSGLSHVTIHHADLIDGVDGRFDLVTCNAPIPANVGPLWRSTADATLFARLLAEAPGVLAPGGMMVVHGALAHLAPIVASLPGERIVVSYVPEGGAQFGITWWQPDAPTRYIATYRELTPERPHLTYRDREAAAG